METYSLAQRAFAEALGTALLVLVGPGSVVATLVLAGDSTPAITGADLLGHLVRIRPDHHRARLRARQGVGLSHQPGRDVRARGHEALPVARGPDATGARRSSAPCSARSASGPCSPPPAIDLGMGQTSLQRGHRHLGARRSSPRASARSC